MCFNASYNPPVRPAPKNPTTPMPHRQQIRNAIRKMARWLRGSNMGMSGASVKVMDHLKILQNDTNYGSIAAQVEKSIRNSKTLFIMRSGLLRVRKTAKL